MEKIKSIKFVESKSKKACGACPFKRNSFSEKPNPGGSHPFVYLGQIRGPFWLPCHKDKDYIGKGSNPAVVSQCRGAAIFRANSDIPYELPDKLLALEKDTNNVFTNESEFLQHYLDIDEETADKLCTDEKLEEYMNKEMYTPRSTKRVYK